MEQDGQESVVVFQNTGQFGTEDFKKRIIHGSRAVHGKHYMGDTGFLPRRQIDALVKVAAVWCGPCRVTIRTVLEKALKDTSPVQCWVQPFSEQTEKARRHISHMLGTLHSLNEFNVGFLLRLLLRCSAAAVQYRMITHFSCKSYRLCLLPIAFLLTVFGSSVSPQ